VLTVWGRAAPQLPAGIKACPHARPQCLGRAGLEITRHNPDFAFAEFKKNVLTTTGTILWLWHLLHVIYLAHIFRQYALIQISNFSTRPVSLLFLLKNLHMQTVCLHTQQTTTDTPFYFLQMSTQSTICGIYICVQLSTYTADSYNMVSMVNISTLTRPLDESTMPPTGQGRQISKFYGQQALQPLNM